MKCIYIYTLYCISVLKLYYVYQQQYCFYLMNKLYFTMSHYWSIWILPFAICQQSNQCVIFGWVSFMYFFIWLWRSVTRCEISSFSSVILSKLLFNPSSSMAYEFFTSFFCNTIYNIFILIDFFLHLLKRDYLPFTIISQVLPFYTTSNKYKCNDKMKKKKKSRNCVSEVFSLFFFVV